MENIIKYERFQGLNEGESHDLNHFEAACLAEGIKSGDLNLLFEGEILIDSDDLNEKIKLGKILKKVGGFVKDKALGFLKSTGLPIVGPIAGILDKVVKGVGSLKGLKGTKTNDFAVAAKQNPELGQVSNVAQETMERIMKDFKEKGAGALMSKNNQESVGNLFALFNAVGQAKTEISKGAKTA
jgi:hypothetical protein